MAHGLWAIDYGDRFLLIELFEDQGLDVIVSQLDALNSFKLARPSHVYVQISANEFSFNFTVLFVAK